ncbi:MAG: uroporphyrinogen decarboxylase family protein [Desulfotomaculales bacterium]
MYIHIWQCLVRRGPLDRHHQCLAGGIPDSLFILGTPQEMRARVKLLCEKLGRDGGLIINGGCNIPYDTKPANYRAMIDAIIEYGTDDKSIKPAPRTPQPGEAKPPVRPRMITPWEVKRAELGGVTGDEELIRKPWEMLESMGYAWIWQWVL